MSDEKWQKVREIFDSALSRKSEERQNYIFKACDGDKTLLAEVESLLSSLDSAESFMEKPAVAKVVEAFENNSNKLKEGNCLGHYEIIRSIGTGGMGEVYLAQDKTLDRLVAIKILSEQFSLHESNINRFISEAKAASALNHPNILTIYEFGEAEDAHFIVSEFIEGETLREIIRASRLSLAEILDISIQIADALSAAHKAHLVHRDIKPENIMIRPDGYVKILDFGLAKLIQPKQAMVGLENETAKQNETAKGVILGTVNYMSPEQAKGEKVDERTDIFSLGAVIYEMLTGRTPFQGDSASETFANLLNSEPPLIDSFVSDVPAEFQRIISKLLRKGKDERYQTMKGLSADLKDLRENLSLEEKLERSTLPEGENATAILQTITDEANLQTTETSHSFSQQLKKHKPLAAVVLMVLLIGAIGVVYYFFYGNKSQIVFQAGQVTRLTSSGRVKTATVSPDGKFVIYAQEENNQQQSLWMQHIGSESNLQIVPPANIEFRSLDISPDSNSLFYLDASGTLYRTAILGGSPKKVTDGLGNFFGNQISISPDNGQIAFTRRLEEDSPLFIANADGTNERRFTSFEKIRQLQRSAWSPDGKVIASVYYNSGHDNILAVQVADGTSKPILPQDWNFLLNLTWLPDSKSLLTNGIKNDTDTNYQIWQISYPGGEARQITNDTNNYDSVSLTSDGRILTAIRNEQIGYVWTMPANGDDIALARQLTVGFEKWDGGNLLGWLPDGKIVYDSMPSGKSSVWAMEIDGSNPRQLLKDVAPFALSPDGHYLVSQKDSGDNIGLWRTDLKDGSEFQLTKGTDVWATFSPDGKWVVFTRFADKVTLWKVPIEGGEPTQIVYKGLICPAVSPDGKMIAAVMGKIILISFDDGKVIRTLDIRPEKQERSTKQNLQWTPDGRGIYYVALNNGVSNIWRQPIDGSPPVQVTKFETGRIFNFAYSPDGKQLALSRGSLNSDVVLIENSN